MDTEVVELPFAYVVGYVAAGGSVVRPVKVRGHAPFEVRSVRGSDAPLAARWGSYTSRTLEGRSYRGVPTTSLLRRLAPNARDAPMDEEWRAIGLPDLTTKLARKACEAKQVRSPCDLPDEASAVASGNGGRGRASRKDWDDMGTRMAEAARSWSEGLLLVDGVPWIAAPEPRLIVGHEKGRVVLRSGVDSDKRHFATFEFRADHMEEAVQFGRRSAGFRGVRFHDMSGGGVETLDADALAWDESVAPAKAVHECLALIRGSNRPLVPGETAEGRRALEDLLSHDPAARDRDWSKAVLASPRLKALLDANVSMGARTHCLDHLRAWDGVRHAYPNAPAPEDEEADHAALATMP